MLIKNYKNKKSGFALLYALLITGALVSVGVILMNIITKQLVFSSVGRGSETSYYYLASSGRECLKYYDSIGVFDSAGNKSVQCFDDQEISLTSSSGRDITTFTTEGDTVDDQGRPVVLTVSKNSNAPNNGTDLIDRFKTVITVEGLSGTSGRIVRRTAVTVY
ncbi:MAG: hypothetical protein WC531_01035 [Candidatus Paceibacterota bacterium]